MVSFLRQAQCHSFRDKDVQIQEQSIAEHIYYLLYLDQILDYLTPYLFGTSLFNFPRMHSRFSEIQLLSPPKFNVVFSTPDGFNIVAGFCFFLTKCTFQSFLWHLCIVNAWSRAGVYVWWLICTFIWLHASKPSTNTRGFFYLTSCLDRRQRWNDLKPLKTSYALRWKSYILRWKHFPRRFLYR